MVRHENIIFGNGAIYFEVGVVCAKILIKSATVSTIELNQRGHCLCLVVSKES